MLLDRDGVHETACPLDCPDACSLSVTVEGGEVVEVGAGTRNPATGGVICGKVRRFARHLYGDERLRYPLVRSGPKGSGAYERAGWDDALDLIADRWRGIIDTHGAEAILPISYGGSNGHLTQDNIDARLFRRLRTSRLARTVCAVATGAAATGLYGKMVGVPFRDYVHAELIVVWGANPSATGIHLVPIIQAARREGAKLVVVDPRRTPLAKAADLHVAPRPGTDLPVALSLIRAFFSSGKADRVFLDAHATGADELEARASEWSFERAAAESGVDVETLQRFFDWYAGASPAVIRCGWGQERNRNGGSATAAILALPAVAGKFGLRGGGYTMSNSGVWDFQGDASAKAEEPDTRIINMNKIGAELAVRGKGEIRSVFVYNANPVATLPNQRDVLAGFEREELFTVVFDAVLTDTAVLADVVLPATTFLEHDELSKGYGPTIMHRSPPVIPPVGESRPNPAVFADLCRRMGVWRENDPETPDELTRAILETDADGEALRAALASNRITYPKGRGPADDVIQFETAFPPTSDRKAHLFPPELDREAPNGLYGYQPDPKTKAHPLALVSPALARMVSSTFGQLDDRVANVDLHPADAAERGISNGDEVIVFNDLGEVRLRARVSDDVRPGVCSIPKGLWRRHTQSGTTSNVLTPDSLTDLGGGACFNDARVDVRRSVD